MVWILEVRALLIQARLIVGKSKLPGTIGVTWCSSASLGGPQYHTEKPHSGMLTLSVFSNRVITRTQLLRPSGISPGLVPLRGAIFVTSASGPELYRNSAWT